jgi:NAD(P)-dependent dehydrogenase (short-subunit alcohol dehydrogenase family)
VLERTVVELSARAGGRVVAFAANVADPGAATQIVAAALKAFGRIDILVNNAGTSLAKPFEMTSRDDWNTDFDVKL